MVRLIGSFLIVLVLFGLYVVTAQDSTTPIQSTPSFNNDSSLKSLSIN
jgi:hypothetical protein